MRSQIITDCSFFSQALCGKMTSLIINGSGMFQLSTIALIAFIAAISPGPDFVVITKNALSRSRRHGIICTLGVCAGILFHTAYCVMGLALVIAQSVLLFNLIKYLGASYLIYIGLKNLRSKDSPLMLKNTPPNANASETQNTHLQAFTEGFLANVLNPKCTLFMLSIFTVIISPDTNHWFKLGYGIEIMLIAMIWFFFLSVSITLTRVQTKLTQMQHYISRFSGVVLISLGIKVALDSSH